LKHLDRLVTRPLEPAITFHKILVWRHDLNPSAALRAFLDVWREHVASSA